MGVFIGKIVFIFGGSCGIGVVIVCCFVIDGVNVWFIYVGLKDVVKCLV